MKVVLDSCAIREAQPWKGALKALGGLATEGAVELHVPELVVQEVSHGLVGALPLLGKHWQRAIQWVSDGAQRRALFAALAELQEFRRAGADLVEDGLESWLLRAKADIEPLSQADTTAVFERYFAGDPPFGSAKSRTDLPDGFVFDTILRVASPVDETHVITSDQRLRKACDGLAGVTTHAGVTPFMKSERVRELIAGLPEHEDDQAWVVRARELCLRDPNFMEILASIVPAETFDLPVDFPARFDYSEATVSCPSGALTLKVDWPAAKRSVVDDELVIPLRAVAHEVEVEFFSLKSDFWSSGADRVASVIDGDWNDHVLRAQTSVHLKTEGVVEVSFHAEYGRIAKVADLTVADFEIVEASTPEGDFLE